jgi:hypothetical protein
MNLNADICEIPKRKILIAVVVVAVLGGLAFGARHYFQPAEPRPLTLAETREAVDKYLREKADRKEFKSAIDFSKEKRPWETIRAQYDAPPDYKTVYRLLGEHLVFAETLLNSSDTRQQQSGLRLVMQLSDIASDVAVDDWLSARICEAYLLPNISKGEGSRKSAPKQDMIRFAGRAMGRADAAAGDPANRKPWKRGGDEIRMRIANLLMESGQYEEAVSVLRTINDKAFTNAAQQQIVIAEQKLKKSP